MNDQPPSTEPNPSEWLRFAANDLKAARKLQGDPELLSQVVAFHAQQAVEKAVKGCLVNKRIQYPFTHDLEQLFELYEAQCHPIPFDWSDIGELTPFAGHRRYPGWIHPPSQSELRRLLTLAEQVLTWAENIIMPPTQPPPSARPGESN